MKTPPLFFFFIQWASETFLVPRKC